MGNRARVLISGVSTILALAVIAWVAALPAAAKTCYKNIVPPGRSGASQYVEVVPTTCGSATPPSTGTNGSGGSGKSISRLGKGGAGVRSLARLGSEGQAAAKLAEATAPTSARASVAGRPGASSSHTSGSSGHSGGGQSSGKVGTPAVEFGSSGGALSDALTGGGSGGLGLLLPVTMGLVLALAILAGLIRARRGGQRPAA